MPCVTIPVRGRNLASIVEVAAMNNRHRRYGYNAAQELAQRVDLRAEARAQPERRTMFVVALMWEAPTSKQALWMMRDG